MCLILVLMRLNFYSQHIGFYVGGIWGWNVMNKWRVSLIKLITITRGDDQNVDMKRRRLSWIIIKINISVHSSRPSVGNGLCECVSYRWLWWRSQQRRRQNSGPTGCCDCSGILQGSPRIGSQTQLAGGSRKKRIYLTLKLIKTHKLFNFLTLSIIWFSWFSNRTLWWIVFLIVKSRFFFFVSLMLDVWLFVWRDHKWKLT